MFYCWGSVLFLVACSNRPANPTFSNRKLLYSRLISVSHLACLLAKSRHLFFIAWVKRGFRPGLQDLRPKSSHNLRWIVSELTTVPPSINLGWIFLEELIGDWITTLYMTRSSLQVETLGRPDICLSLKVPLFWYFKIALCTAVFPTFTFFAIWRTEKFNA